MKKTDEVTLGGAAKVAAMAVLLVGSLTITPQVSAEGDPDATPYSSKGDIPKGKKKFLACKACHSLAVDGPRKIGPHLTGLFGRKAGGVEGYKYSKALAEADFVWTEEKINQWLLKPRAFLPGNKMAFMGLKTDTDRQNLIAFLRQATAAE